MVLRVIEENLSMELMGKERDNDIVVLVSAIDSNDEYGSDDEIEHEEVRETENGVMLTWLND